MIVVVFMEVLYIIHILTVLLILQHHMSAAEV
jgi:hypothetical protein